MKNLKIVEYALYIIGVVFIVIWGIKLFSVDFSLHGKSYLLAVLVGIGFVIIGRTIAIERAITGK